MLGSHVAIVGATGAVGNALLGVLKKRRFPISKLTLMASAKSVGGTISFAGEQVPIQSLGIDSFKGVDIVFFATDSKTSRKFAPVASKAGAVVIDNSSAFRLDEQVPLVAPEVNADSIKKHQGIIANPNCCALILVLPLAPLHRAFGIKRVALTTYQAASGAGAGAVNELVQASSAYLKNEPFTPAVFPYNPAFNVFPHNSPLDPNGYCEEELKIMAETRKILADDSIAITATCVRVPVMRAHSEAVNMQFSQAVSPEQARKVLRKAAGVQLFEDPANNRWATPLSASGEDNVLVGRLRIDSSQPNSLDLWVVGDQLLKGAALNAVQIAELL